MWASHAMKWGTNPLPNDPTCFIPNGSEFADQYWGLVPPFTESPPIIVDPNEINYHEVKTRET